MHAGANTAPILMQQLTPYTGASQHSSMDYPLPSFVREGDYNTRYYLGGKLSVEHVRISKVIWGDPFSILATIIHADNSTELIWRSNPAKVLADGASFYHRDENWNAPGDEHEKDCLNSTASWLDHEVARCIHFLRMHSDSVGVLPGTLQLTITSTTT